MRNVKVQKIAKEKENHVGLALGSGSARGLAHIGVLHALKDAGIKIDLMAGTSMGALVGALAASGRVADLEKTFRAMDWRAIWALLDPVFPRSGLIDGRKVENLLQQLLPTEHFHELQVPFQAVSTDILSGLEVVLSSGKLVEAIHASFAVPGIFTPLRRNDQLLVDGGLVNPVPVSTVRNMGASFIVAVDLNHDIVQKRLGRAGCRPEERKPQAAVGAAAEPGNIPWFERLRLSWQATESPMLRQLANWLGEKESGNETGHRVGTTEDLANVPTPGIFELLLASIYITQSQITRINLQQSAPDLLIRPQLGHIRFMEFDRASEIIEIGYQAAQSAIEAQKEQLLSAGIIKKP